MKSCSVPLCANDSNKRPDLKYFGLPRNVNIREEWLEVLGVKGDYRGQHLSICEDHFSDLDFKAGKKELKAHAVPLVDVGIISDVEFIPDVSNSKPEVTEIVKIEEVTQGQTTPAKAKKKRSSEEKTQPEPTPITECESGRRPSRRAAVEAAKKIFNTVRNYNVKDHIEPDEALSQQTTPAPKAPATPNKKGVKRRRNYDLEMFCADEELSGIQQACQEVAQDDFNLAMKNMRELTACKVRIVQTGPNPVDFNVSVNVFADDHVIPPPVKVRQRNNRKSIVYPVLLTQVSTMIKNPVFYV